MGIALVSCSSYGKIQVRHDEFKNTSLVSLKLKHESEESIAPLRFYHYPAEVEYIRETGPEKNVPLKLVVLIRAAKDASPLEPAGFLKTDQNNFEIVLNATGNELRTETMTQTTKYHNPDASGFVDYTKPDAVDSKTTVNQWRELTATLALTTDQEQSVLATSVLLLRLYSGTQPLTFRVTGEDLRKIQSMIRLDPAAHGES